MVRVAWVSRHQPLKAQVEELHRLLGNVEIVHVDRTFRDAGEVYREVKRSNCTHAVVVLPLSMIAHLVKHDDVIWLWAEMEALHQCVLDYCNEYNPDTDVWLPLRNSTKGRHMRFKKFWRIREVRMVLEEV